MICAAASVRGQTPIELAIRYGSAYEARGGLSFFFRENVKFSSLFFAALKAAPGGSAVWVRTFHRKDVDEERRMTKKMTLVRPQIL